MAVGRPLLLAWKPDGSAYVYEFVPEKGFVLQSSLAAGNLPSGGGAPFAAFKKNSTRIFFAQRTLATVYVFNLFDLNLQYPVDPITFNPINTRSQRNGETGLTWNAQADDEYILALRNTFGSFNMVLLGSDEEYTFYTGVNFASSNIRAVALQPQRKFLLAVGSNLAYIFPYVKDDADGRPVFNAQNTPDAGGTNSKIRKTIAGTTGSLVAAWWMNTGEYAVIANNAGSVYVGELVDDVNDYTFNIVNEAILDTGFVAQRIRVRKDDKYIAVGAYNATAQVYRTFIYYRMGFILKPIQVITNFGQQLDFTEDGMMLIDAASKRLFTMDTSQDLYVEQSTLMSSVVSGATYQALSHHVIDNSPTGFVYYGAVDPLISREVDVNNLKIMLLDSDATFDPNEDSILDISVNNEVYGGQWPQGGKLLTNVSYGTNENGNFALKADRLSQIVITALTFRHAVLYDATSGKPLIWYQMKREVKTERNINLSFDLSKFGAVQFAS